MSQQPSLRTGAVIVFAKTVDARKAATILRKLEAEGIVDGSDWIGGQTPVKTFDANHGGPVWYIP